MGIRPLLWILVAAASAAFPRSSFAQSYGERDTGFLVTLQEVSDPEPGILVKLVSTTGYPCEGYTILSTVRYDEDTVTVEVHGMLQPTPCFQTDSEATGTTLFGNPAHPRFVFRLTYRGDTDLYRITLLKRTITAEPIRVAFTKLTIQ